MNENKKPEKLSSLADLGAATGRPTPKKIIVLRHDNNMIANPINYSFRPNIGWMFYKDYFKNIGFNYVFDDNNKQLKADNAKSITEKNRRIIENTSLVEIKDGLGETDQCINSKVSYPGIITGVGITHEAGVEGEFKLGLHFDYTYGMPIIHGSSVKGLLRSVFPDFRKGKDKHADSKLEFLLELLEKKFSITADKKNIKDIEDEIFEGKKSDGTRIDIYHRDIFFDAIIINPDSKERVVASDALAPHGKNPLKNPIPLPFLKISPGCTIQFRFDLKKGEILVADQKKKLFQEIITTLGVGAKTNVGYGQFEP